MIIEQYDYEDGVAPYCLLSTSQSKPDGDIPNQQKISFLACTKFDCLLKFSRTVLHTFDTTINRNVP